MIAARRAVTIGAAAVLLSLAGAACGAERETTGSVQVQDATVTGRADHEFVIPLGAAARADAGEHLLIFPARLEVRVGETIRIVNQDERMQIVGPFSIGPGQTLTQRFSTPGEFVGVCTTHPGTSFTLVVLP
jgi:plastocyanin